MHTEQNLELRNKYYTPELKEFYVGFEYEALVDYYKEEYEEFVVEDTDSMRSILSTWDRGEQEYWRVKYLDSKDIESCGFKFRGKSIDDWFKMEKIQNLNGRKFTEIIMHYGYHDKQLTIDGIYCGDEETLFRGKTKNLSELKQVLEMIGVEYDR